MRPSLLLLALTACGGFAIQQAAQLPITFQTLSPPLPSAEDTARIQLAALAQDAPLPSAAPFVWLWWAGEVPAGVQGQRWSDLNDFRAADWAHLGGPRWDAFARGLGAAFPDSLTVYRLPAGPCLGECKAFTVIIEGRAPWGVGGFMGSVQHGF